MVDYPHRRAYALQRRALMKQNVITNTFSAFVPRAGDIILQGRDPRDAQAFTLNNILQNV
ncbi:hypothetical protein KCP77_13390 [Salmonella enterica subsp. enterica]|nr:hypothetical protein KCP77_13390 [Salmonella enterica subsp. enterica]